MENIVKHTTTRKELYDEVWDVSAAAVARKYDIPYQQFLAQLKEADIPTPPSGYWTKLNSGKPVTVAELSGNFDEVIELSEKIKQTFYEEPEGLEEVEVIQPDTDVTDENKDSTEDATTITLYNQTYNYYDRNTLYKEIWENPVTEVAKKYHVSDNAIRKVCKSLNIPTPPAGYWAKLRSGGKVKKTPLPKGNYPEGKRGLRNNQWEKSEKGLSVEERLSFLDTDDLVAIISVADQIALPDDNEKFHTSVLKQRKTIVKWQKESAKVQAQGWGKHNLDAPPMNADSLSEEGLQRSCRILDALIKVLEPFDCKLLPDQSCFLIDGERVTYSFSESKDKIPHVLTKKENMDMLEYQESQRTGGYAYEPRIRKYDHPFNGKLSLKLINNRIFRDSKSYQLEERLSEILLTFYEASEFVRQERLNREEEERKKEEERQARERKINRYNQEVEQTLFLLNEAEDFEKATLIRNYIQAAEQSDRKDKYTEEWFEWAKKKADWLDPTIAAEDEYFEGREHKLDSQKKQLKEKNSYWYY